MPVVYLSTSAKEVTSNILIVPKAIVLIVQSGPFQTYVNRLDYNYYYYYYTVVVFPSKRSENV